MAPKTKTVPPASEWAEVFNSAIHGRGMIASRFIPAETPIIQYVGEKVAKEESDRRGVERCERSKITGEAAVYIFELNEEWDLDGSGEDNVARLINHSCHPNCEAEQNDADEIWVKALRDIQPGEELSFDYGYDIAFFMDHPCRCGAANCVGYIVRSDQRDKLKRLLGRRKRGAERKA